MISREKFKYYLNKIKQQDDKEGKFNEALNILGDGDGYAFIYSTAITVMIGMLSDLCGLGENDILYYYCFDLDFGSNTMAVKCIEDNGKTFNLTSDDELYDYILHCKSTD